MKEKHTQLDRLAEQIDTLARASLRDGVLGGILLGHEDEIRQDAILLALDWIMRGDREGAESHAPEKKKAKGPWNLSQIVANALRICKLRTIRHLSTEEGRNVTLDESNGGFGLHHTNLAPWEWSFAIRREMALSALQIAVRSGRLSPSNACVARLILDGSMSVEDVARRLKVTGNAIYQRLKPIRRILAVVVAEIEVPFF